MTGWRRDVFLLWLGLISGLLLIAGYHGWQDHRVLWQLVAIEAARQQQQQTAIVGPTAPTHKRGDDR